ncbi:MAG: septum formation inhibitor Maf [Actinobacteria bacterium]|nr:septum formation inhibitor Maf [Actinomycetota bacterium]
MPPPLILASSSPRRRALLADLTSAFIATDIDETPVPNEEPATYVERLAVAKATTAMVTSSAESAIIAADTCVALDQLILGKPSSEAQAAQMLRALSGRDHDVFTGVAVINTDGATRSCVVHTIVTFNDLSQADIAWYVATGEPMDKAGAYGIQGKGGVLVERINGSASNVVGLPMVETMQLLTSAGLNVAALRSQS